MTVLLFMIKMLMMRDSPGKMIKRSQEIKSDRQETMMTKMSKIVAIVAIAQNVLLADVAQVAVIVSALTVAKMDVIIAVMHHVKTSGQQFTILLDDKIYLDTK